MTPEERASKIVHNVDIGWLEDEIIFAIKEAVKLETEACAKIAEHPDYNLRDGIDIARAIRARGGEK